jgi:hypothetical protein
MIQAAESGVGETRKNASICVANLCAGASAEQVLYLVDVGAIPALVKTLTLDAAPDSLITSSLNAIRNVLKAGWDWASLQGESVNIYVDAFGAAGAKDALTTIAMHPNDNGAYAARMLSEAFGIVLSSSAASASSPGGGATTGRGKGGGASPKGGAAAAAAAGSPKSGGFSFGAGLDGTAAGGGGGAESTNPLALAIPLSEEDYGNPHGVLRVATERVMHDDPEVQKTGVIVMRKLLSRGSYLL